MTRFEANVPINEWRDKHDEAAINLYSESAVTDFANELTAATYIRPSAISGAKMFRMSANDALNSRDTRPFLIACNGFGARREIARHNARLAEIVHLMWRLGDQVIKYETERASKWSQPHMNTCNPGGVTSALPVPWIRMRYLMKRELMESIGPPEPSCTGRKTTEKAVTSRPPTADGRRSGTTDSGARYGLAGKRCRKIAWLSQRYGFRSKTDFQIRVVSIPLV
ncbi:hypothetical protein EVAR_90199_1 [Eumeta japonica]|uniref:Uncharacterized protein n=1 Tax=Eumeta variegata TaxID=151549 RepID=A0A4C1WYI0_EUMVA|nr:hypothetical protein EVAR_90199_1 [Eumeta japonica]